MLYNTKLTDISFGNPPPPPQQLRIHPCQLGHSSHYVAADLHWTACHAWIWYVTFSNIEGPLVTKTTHERSSEAMIASRGHAPLTGHKCNI